MKRFIHCPVCPKLHEIIEITVECNKAGDAQHVAHVYCDALGKIVSPELVEGAARTRAEGRAMREIFRPWPTDDYYAAWMPMRLFENEERPSLEEIAETYEEVTDLIQRTELAEPEYHAEHPVRDIAFFAMIKLTA